jgi:NhaA family Na+:H+ antiporter
MEAAVHPWSAYVVLPLFALANAGVPVSAEAIGDALTSSLGVGVLLGLVLGKPLGLLLGAWLAVRVTPGELPAGVTLSSILALGFVAGIGFTVALFISSLALPREYAAEAKVAILMASVVASALGYVAFVVRSRLARA